MKGALGIGLLSLLVAFGCGKDSNQKPQGDGDGGPRASGGKSSGTGGRNSGGADPGDAGPDGPLGTGGVGVPDGSVDGGGGTAGGGGAGTGGATGSGGQGGGPSKEPSSDPAKPVVLEANDVVSGTIPAGEHYWRIPTHMPGRFGLILKSEDATVGFSETAEGGLTSPGVNGCMTYSKGACGIRVDGTFLTAGQFVTVFVFGPQGTAYELELVPLSVLEGAPPTEGYSQTVVYETSFTGTMPTGDGALTKSTPSKITEIWRKTDTATEWFTLEDFTCAARPLPFTGPMKDDVTNVTIGESSYSVSNGNSLFPSAAGAAFTSGQSLPFSVTVGGTPTATTLTAPAFTGDITGSLEAKELWFDWANFSADVAVLSFVADTPATDQQITCREDDVARGGTRSGRRGMNEKKRKQIVARGLTTESIKLSACKKAAVSQPVAAALFPTPDSQALLCQTIRVPATQLEGRF